MKDQILKQIEAARELMVINVAALEWLRDNPDCSTRVREQAISKAASELDLANASLRSLESDIRYNRLMQ